MGAPAGNQYALGNKGGRPRIHKREELMQNLLAWSKKQHSLNLNRWVGDNDLSYEYINRWAREDKEFSLILDKVKVNLAANREAMLCQGMLHPVAYKAQLNVYDKFALDQWKEDKEYEYGLKNKIEDNKKSINITLVEKPWNDQDNDSAQVSMPSVSDSDMGSSGEG